jgi:hypothetical protein
MARYSKKMAWSMSHLMLRHPPPPARLFQRGGAVGQSDSSTSRNLIGGLGLTHRKDAYGYITRACILLPVSRVARLVDASSSSEEEEEESPGVGDSLSITISCAFIDAAFQRTCRTQPGVTRI